MKITWHGHACFEIECNEGILVLDPYQDESVYGLKPLKLKANEVLCSHDHHDHNAKEVVEIIEKKVFHVQKIASFHDDKQGLLRGENTIHMITTEGMRVVHLGDLGCDVNVDLIQDCDVLMIPIGGYYTIDSNQAYALVQKVNPKVVLPMHYRSEAFGFDVLESAEHFQKLSRNVMIYDTNVIEVNKETKPQTAFLRYR